MAAPLKKERGFETAPEIRPQPEEKFTPQEINNIRRIVIDLVDRENFRYCTPDHTLAVQSYYGELGLSRDEWARAGRELITDGFISIGKSSPQYTSNDVIQLNTDKIIECRDFGPDKLPPYFDMDLVDSAISKITELPTKSE